MVVGAKGQLGIELCHLLASRGANYFAFNSSELDITNNNSVREKLIE